MQRRFALLIAVLAVPLAVPLPARPVMAKPYYATPAQVAARFVADFAAQRAAPMADYVARDANMTVPLTPAGPQVLRGRAQTSGYFSQLFAKYARIELSGVTITPAADGQTVFVEALARYTTAAGASHRVGNVWAMVVKRGQIVGSRSYSIPE